MLDYMLSNIFVFLDTEFGYIKSVLGVLLYLDKVGSI